MLCKFRVNLIGEQRQNMITDVFATKLGMTQAWTNKGRRMAVTRLHAPELSVVGQQSAQVVDKNSQDRKLKPATIYELGFGNKKIKNMSKPLQSKLEKGGFSVGVAKIKGVRVTDANEGEQDTIKVGGTVNPLDILEVGDVVNVQGVTKGRGFAGAVKRYGFAGGPKTHGQSDRTRAVGSIGAGTTPGRVYRGKKMPGQYGTEVKTITNLVVVYLDPETKEVWLSGPVPGPVSGHVKIAKTGKKKSIELNRAASGLKEEVVAEDKSETEVESDKKENESN